MRTHASASGLPILGDVLWGSSLCHFYETRADLRDTLVPFFQAGMEANERCLWITSELPQEGEEVARVAPEAAARPEPKKKWTPRVDWAGLLKQDIRGGRVRLRQVWRQGAGCVVREGSGSGASDLGAHGTAHGECKGGPGVRATPGRVVLRLKPPKPTGPGPCRAPRGRVAWKACTLRGLRGRYLYD